VHHFSLLIGYGVSVINPYLAFETIDRMIEEGCTGVDYKTACKKLRQGRVEGVIKLPRRWASRRCRATAAHRCSRHWPAPDVIDDTSAGPIAGRGIGTD